MKKFVTIISIALILLVVGYFIGIYTFVNGNIASVIIKNQTERSIMTATINHESGSIIAANIKKGHSQRTRFVTNGGKTYSIKVTFDDNRTIYSDSDRAIKNGDITVEAVTDSGIVSTTRK